MTLIIEHFLLLTCIVGKMLLLQTLFMSISQQTVELTKTKSDIL